MINTDPPCKFGFIYGPEDDAYMSVGNHEISIDGTFPRFFKLCIFSYSKDKFVKRAPFILVVAEGI